MTIDNIITVCCACPSVKNKVGEYVPISKMYYNALHSNDNTKLSHGYCPPCCEQAKIILSAYD